ncbi:hypothetical protein J2N86_14585 (plasmid) [Legionella lytica]|uniref:Uncharacterized protein n=1 Tax=Legionella lytica TaxID=96232 RepID=A0ABY4YEF8_9GAMM|nr:hypothetical protein [Legionella lytica]USQ15464.1 hypothetical protein J2N86_14585 [Legionella lytica]
MDEKILDSLLSEKDRIEGAISDELVEKDIREIQREALELLNKIVHQLKKEESTNDLSWEKNNLFYSISLLNHNIRFYPTLLGLRASLTWMDKALSKKGELSSSEKKEMEQVNIDLLADHINTLIHIVDGE